MKKYPEFPILIVDDYPEDLDALQRALSMHKINNVILCPDSRQVMGHMEKQIISIVILDLYMPHLSGQELLEKIRNKYPGVHVIIATGSSDLKVAISCIKNGAYDFLVKPVDPDVLLKTIKQVLELIELKDENVKLRKSLLFDELQRPEIFAPIITNNPVMKNIFRYMEAIAASNEPVLITGENGVGKELIVKALHELSGCKGELVTLDVSGLNDDMFTDTLFGHKKGAFTGAETDRQGMVKKAAEGTLFLDEIGDLSITSQQKLLRLIQESEYFPLGFDIPFHSDARIICATNKDLKNLIRKGKFKEDLYFRLNIHTIHIPPLRERIEDIPLLVDHFITTLYHNQKSGQEEISKPFINDELEELLSSYTFPGNIRELENIIKNAVYMHNSGHPFMRAVKEKLDKQYILPNNNADTHAHSTLPVVLFSGRLPTYEEAEILLTKEALKRHQNNQTRAAKVLGISQQALSRKKKKFEEEGLL
ncbi:MAG: sigma-54-dependent Fis family transcriptional regulator [Spirochaetales bacterium]|nr:sigma-54-dependent Fis family transcriptional regulator [Spirochaetales bacterium]